MSKIASALTIRESGFGVEQLLANATAGVLAPCIRWRVQAGAEWQFDANNPQHTIWATAKDTATTPAALLGSCPVLIQAARNERGDGAVTLFDGNWEQLNDSISDSNRRAQFQEGVTLHADRVITMFINSPTGVNTSTLAVKITGRQFN